ncbi:MAG: endonuclease [Paludibacter sp.]|nr:endonuclease [Paludibacter sp.]
MKKIFLLLIGVAITAVLSAQVADSLSSHSKSVFRVMCYNVENLFDLDDDSLTRDEEYLPGQLRGWSYTRYRRKQVNIARAIVSCGWEPPALVGLCEVESQQALKDLTCYSPMKSLNYRFVHYESPDARGIDVALLYQPLFFRPLFHKPVAICFPHAPLTRTRDILYVMGKIPTGDTLHCFVCHFPSRLGGELNSEINRTFVASVLRREVDSLQRISTATNILIMGDFNDYPDNNSLCKVTGAVEVDKEGDLVNLMFPLHRAGKGSHKYEGKWGMLDQLIVSRPLLNPASGLYTYPDKAGIMENSFLLEEDTKYFGFKPFRTYNGMKYHGGYSDHLPVFIDFYY